MNKYSSYKDSGVEWIGEIPKHWTIPLLRHLKNSGLCEYQDGNHGSVHPKNDDFVDKGIPFLRPTDVFQNYIDKKKLKYIPREYVKKLRIGFCKTGDLIFVNRGNIGVTTILEGFDDDEFIIINPQLTYLRFKESNYLTKYFHFLSQSNIFKSNRDLKLGNGSVLNFLGLGDLGDYVILHPPHIEQQQIVTFLDNKTKKIDSLIEKTQRKIKLLKEKKLKLIEGILLNSKTKRIRLEHVVDLIKRPIEREENNIYTKIGMYNWGRGIFKYPSELGSELGDSSFNYLKERDLLLSGQFSWEGSVSIVENEEDNCISSHRFHILNGKKDKILNEYLWSYFTSQEGHFILNENSPGSAGRNRPLNIGKLLKEKIPVPEIDVQMKIKRLVIETRNFEKYSKKNNELLKEYRQSLISEVVTGKVRVCEEDNSLSLNSQTV